MRRLVIAVDCDDVLVATTPFLVNVYNEKYGTKATLTDARDPSPKIWDGDGPIGIERWGQLTEEPGYKDLGPDPQEATILRELALNHELHLVTARKEHERAFTRDMLERELKGVFTSMEFVGWGGSKGEACKRLSADVLIDDNAEHLHDAIANGLSRKGAILYGDYPWNKADSTHRDITYCLDWVSVQKVIDGLASEE